VNNGGDPDALERDLGVYYATAREVSAALIAGSPVAQLESKIEAMRRTQQALATDLDTATAPDRRRLAAAFASARGSQRDALRIEIAVALAAVALMTLLSWRIISRTVTALRDVSAGVQQLARGEFGNEIPVTAGDELGDLAREANRTAARLREYREHTQTLLKESQLQAEEVRKANASLIATQQLLEERAAQLERVSSSLRAKNSDLENVSQTLSHDLRAPLRSIRSFSQVLAESAQDKLDPDAADALARILRGSERMGTMLDDLYRLLRLSSDEAVSAEVDSNAVLRDVTENLRSDLAQSGGTITHDPLPKIRGSAMLLGQIFQNLIANAIKFHGTDQPQIHVEAVRVADSWQFSVRDNGVGIEPDARERVFRLFERLSSSGTGTGIGLTLCKRAVEKLGGRIWIEDASGPGTTFCFTIPA
jgi:signal transduction histidine kinase